MPCSSRCCVRRCRPLTGTWRGGYYEGLRSGGNLSEMRITFMAAVKYDLYNETLNLTMIDGQNPFAEGKTQLQLTRCPDT